MLWIWTQVIIVNGENNKQKLFDLKLRWIQRSIIRVSLRKLFKLSTIWAIPIAWNKCQTDKLIVLISIIILITFKWIWKTHKFCDDPFQSKRSHYGPDLRIRTDTKTIDEETKPKKGLITVSGANWSRMGIGHGCRSIVACRSFGGVIQYNFFYGDNFVASMTIWVRTIRPSSQFHCTDYHYTIMISSLIMPLSYTVAH